MDARGHQPLTRRLATIESRLDDRGRLGRSLAMIAVHELGHVLSGKAAGFAYHSVRIGPFQFAEKQGLSSKDESLVDRVTSAINDAIVHRG
jgi:hypothetical protein